MAFYHVYFRIEAGYVWGSGMSRERLEAFYAEIKTLFCANGWKIQPVGRYGNSVYVVKDKTRLYVHPMELSGACDENDILSVEEILRKGVSWSFVRTDRYELLLDISDGELLDWYRKEKSDEADRLIIDAFKPSPFAKVHDIGPTLMRVGGDVRVQTLDHYLGRSSLDPDQEFLRERFDALVKGGRIVSYGKAARTLTADEWKELSGGLFPVPGLAGI